MKNTILKKFIGETWEQCIAKVSRFIIDYNLELISLEMHKDEQYYIANIEYNLGLDRRRKNE